MDAYPYIVSNNKIEPVLSKIRSAARPDRVTIQLLKKWGFTASNDRAMVRILKALGVLDENGTPTEHYDRLRDPNEWRYALADRLKDTYSELYSIDEKIHAAADGEVKGAISRVTGKDEDMVARYFATFKSLTNLAKFDGAPPKRSSTNADKGKELDQSTAPEKKAEVGSQVAHSKTALHYNIQIHLPATTDIAVYNAIFKTLREQLLVQ